MLVGMQFGMRKVFSTKGPFGLPRLGLITSTVPIVRLVGLALELVTRKRPLLGFNPNSGRFLVTNSSASPTNLTIGTVDVINPNLGSPNGPFVENTFLMPNCMPTSIVQGPGNDFLVGCGDHDGEAFPPNMYVIDGTTGKIITEITNVGGVDEVWYNAGDNRYYTASRDMPNGPVMGVIDAKTNTWLQNVATNSNSHSIAVDSGNNHAFVPLQAGGICTTQSSNGCIGVYAQQ